MDNLNQEPIPKTAASRGLATIMDVASRQLPASGIDCILIGGFAVNYHGYTRNTLDVDFMIIAQQLEIVRRIMIQAGFTNVIIAENAAFFSAPDSPLRVDFLTVDEATMRQLLVYAINAKVYQHEIKVPALRDLIAMKIFALAQNVDRRMGKDLPDIAYLSIIHNLNLAVDIRPLCDRFGTPKVYELIRRQVKALRSP